MTILSPIRWIFSDFNCFLEFTALDKQLDELNSVLDVLEAKNEDIHGKLKELLQSSRQERLKMSSPDETNISRADRNEENDRRDDNSSAKPCGNSSRPTTQ